MAGYYTTSPPSSAGGKRVGEQILFLSQNDLIPMQSGSSTMTHLQSWPDATGAVRAPPYQMLNGIYTWTHYHVASVGRQRPLKVSLKEGPCRLSMKGILEDGFIQCQQSHVERNLHEAVNKPLFVGLHTECNASWWLQPPASEAKI